MIEIRKPIQPWELNPYGLVSWLEMLQFSAQAFFWAGYALQHITADCLIGSMIVPKDQPIFNMNMPIDDLTKGKVTASFDYIEKQYRDIGMRITADTVHDIKDEVTAEKSNKSFQWLSDQIAAIKKLAHREMKDRVFFYVAPERAHYFPTRNEPDVFGRKVAKAFPSCAFDAHEAACCLGFSRGTASVFHLMRVLEIGLSALGAKFGVSLAHTNWGPAIEEIESKIRNMHKDPAWKAMPDYKEQQEFYAQAASHFGVMKDAWRNYTMHARGKFTEEEAAQQFVNVRSFMQKLAERLSE